MPFACGEMRKVLKTKLIALFCLSLNVSAEGVSGIVEAFMASDIRFNRTLSDVPFIPLGYVTSKYYQDNPLETAGEPILFKTINKPIFLNLPHYPGWSIHRMH